MITLRHTRSRHWRTVALAAAAASAVSVSAAGWMAAAAPTGAPSSMHAITPCRLVDTRPGTDNIGTRNTPLAADEDAAFQVTGTNGNCNVPAGATAIAANVSIVNPTANSFLTVYPTGDARPLSSNLNWTAGAFATPNHVTVGLSSGGAVSTYNLAGTVDVIVDIVGYYTVATALAPVAPTTVLGFDAPWGPATSPGNNGNTIITPTGCRTAPHVAAAGQTAAAVFSATASATVNDVLYLDVMVSVDGGLFKPVTVTYAADSLSAGTAHATVQKSVELVAGSTYVFAAGVSTKASASFNAGYCQGLVTISTTS